LLRHDVDRLPKNALKVAQLENRLGIQSVYFFRMVSHVFKPEIIKQIASLGHEIGYHYEDVDLAYKYLKKNSPSQPLTLIRERPPLPCRQAGFRDPDDFREGSGEKELINISIQLFEKHLIELREIAPIKTICMHGSPLSKHDNRLLWKHYNYKDYGIHFEPYFDLDYNEVFYITDTGRQWNNENISVRDKVNSGFDIPVKNTNHLIQLINSNQLPDKIMINTHPHRWFNPGFGWAKEIIMQNIKNIVKYYLIKRKK
jgi:hypothetical protein